MAENFYGDVAYLEEVRTRKQVAMSLNTYVNSKDILRSNTHAEKGNNTARNPQVQPRASGINSAWRVMAVCVLLLCVLLLIAVTVLWIKFSILNTANNQLQTRYNNLTIEKDQLSILQKKINEGWTCFQSNIYYISTEKKSWTESRKDCVNRGADLLIINSKEEQDFVQSKNNKAGVYIGLTDRDKEGVFKWVDGTLLSNITSYWSSGNYFSDIDDCVVSGYNGSLGWYDRPCTETYYWMCE